ncbi:ATP-binding protein [Gilliamella sp. wkB108]|uniref:ATP-binding protein n=1 Tax=Gilliamella sp. wkB108 TaxID=3120256 RepID=UPI001C3FFEE5|nr:ATP-binding protein [Gilliamella apicola]
MDSGLSKTLERAETDLTNSINGLKEIDGLSVTETIANCQLHGEYKKWSRKITMMATIKTETICPVCAKEKVDQIKQQIADKKAKTKELEITKLLSWAEIPKRFELCTFDNYLPGNKSAERNLRICKAYAEKWEDRLKNGGGMVMVGLPGTGKNHLAVSIMKEIIKNHQHYVLLTSVNKIIREYRSTWSKDTTKSESEVIAEFSSPELLVIDEVGVQYGSDSERLIIFEIINTRYEEMRPTILISNETREQLAEIVGERVIDRMKDGGGCELVFDWESYRK